MTTARIDYAAVQPDGSVQINFWRGVDPLPAPPSKHGLSFASLSAFQAALAEAKAGNATVSDTAVLLAAEQCLGIAGAAKETGLKVQIDLSAAVVTEKPK